MSRWPPTVLNCSSSQTYSPDFNSIGQAFAKIKSALHHAAARDWEELL